MWMPAWVMMRLAQRGSPCERQLLPMRWEMLSIQRAPQDENVHCTGVRKCRKDFGPAVGAVSDYRHFSGAEVGPA